MDITDTLAPNSDQLDAVDLLGGPRTFTIERVSKGDAEQPVQVHLAEFPRVWRPGKSMRRVLAACWGPDSSQWTGRRVRLYCDPDVIFGKDKVGGTRIAALSNIDKARSIPLLVSRGKSAMFTVEPLVERVERDWQAEADALADADALRSLYREAPASSAARAYIQARAAHLVDATPPAPAAHEVIDTTTGEVIEVAEPPADEDGWPEVAPIGGQGHE